MTAMTRNHVSVQATYMESNTAPGKETAPAYFMPAGMHCWSTARPYIGLSRLQRYSVKADTLTEAGIPESGVTSGGSEDTDSVHR